MASVTLNALKNLGLALFIGAITLSYTKAFAQVLYDTSDDVPEYDRETWQLISADEAVWAEVRTVYTNFPDEIKRSVIDQFKLVTWSSGDEINHSAIWLDCNLPKMETRRRITTPAQTTELRDADGNVSYRSTPAEYKYYTDIIRNSEGCSLKPPIENLHAAPFEQPFYALFKQSRRVRYGDALVYINAEGTSVANFKLLSER